MAVISVVRILLVLHAGVAHSAIVNDFSEIVKAKETRLITLKTFEVPAGVTLNLTNLLPGTVVEFDGILSFGYAEWTGPLIRFQGDNITVVGRQGHLVDCRGQRWWDRKGTNGGKVKPKFAILTLNNSTVTGLNVKNTPAHGFAIDNSDVVDVTDVRIDNSEGDVDGHNTDGFDVNSNNIRIAHSWIHNQDDCLAVNSGQNLVFENNTCIGGHGISIGSIGFRSNNIVQHVTIRNCSVVNSTNGIRIKIKTNATGIVDDIVYNNVVLRNITNYGILFHSNYRNVGNMVDEPTGGVPVTNVKLICVRGNVESRGTNVYVALGNASDWRWDDVDVEGGQREMECRGVPFDVKFECGK